MTLHHTAEVSDSAKIGKGTRIWNHSQIRENVRIGTNCTISKNVYIDHDIIIGDNVKIQNNVSIYYKAIVENGVFIGPHVCFTNDKIARSVTPDGKLKSGGSEGTDWKIEETIIKEGASIGANSTILPGLTIGRWAMVGAGSIVTKNVPDYALVVGCPAKIVGYVCECGKKMQNKKEDTYFCSDCAKEKAINS